MVRIRTQKFTGCWARRGKEVLLSRPSLLEKAEIAKRFFTYPHWMPQPLIHAALGTYHAGAQCTHTSARNARACFYKLRVVRLILLGCLKSSETTQYKTKIRLMPLCDIFSHSTGKADLLCKEGGVFKVSFKCLSTPA